jgi:hypothetical protein
MDSVHRLPLLAAWSGSVLNLRHLSTEAHKLKVGSEYFIDIHR